VTEDKRERLKTKRVGEIMIPLDEYPHIPEQFTLGQAIMEMERAHIEIAGRRSLPRLLLVFNKENQLAGIIRRRDLLRGLEPRFLRHKPRDERTRLFDVGVDPNLLELSADRLIKDMQKRANRPVTKVMKTKVITIDYDDHLIKAVYTLVENDITSLPVVKDNQVVGVVRTVELFHEIAQLVL